MSKGNNILSNKEHITDEELLQYINQNLDDAATHALEETMLNDDFTNDAVEGLSAFTNKASLNNYVTDLNRQLHKQTQAQKLRKNKRLLAYDNKWSMYGIALIILLCIAAFCIVRLYKLGHI